MKSLALLARDSLTDRPHPETLIPFKTELDCLGFFSPSGTATTLGPMCALAQYQGQRYVITPMGDAYRLQEERGMMEKPTIPAKPPQKICIGEQAFALRSHIVLVGARHKIAKALRTHLRVEDVTPAVAMTIRLYLEQQVTATFEHIAIGRKIRLQQEAVASVDKLKSRAILL